MQWLGYLLCVARHNESASENKNFAAKNKRKGTVIKMVKIKIKTKTSTIITEKLIMKTTRTATMTMNITITHECRDKEDDE